MDESRAADLANAIQTIRDRVAARYPTLTTNRTQIPLVDLTSILHARDSAEAKVAAIGTVNPRPPGLVNNAIQAVKRTLARSLSWLWRDQIEFNRQQMIAVQATLDALNDFNRLAVDLSSRIDAIHPRMEQAEAQARELSDIHSHWITWRREWEHKLTSTEIQFLRSVADMQGSFQQRVGQSEQLYRDQLRRQHNEFRDQLLRQHDEFQRALEQAADGIQSKLWEDLRKVKLEYERVIYDELRVIRQRASVASSTALSQPAESYDSWFFSDQFRGTEEYVKSCFEPYVDLYRGCRAVLDIGCGRGEFLELLAAQGIAGRGIDAHPQIAAFARAKGLDIEVADLFEYLGRKDSPELDGIFCAQVIEHLPPQMVPEFFRLCAARLPSGGPILLETPNPECLAIFATHFYLDPTHTKPLPAQLLNFYLKEAGFGEIEITYRQPAEESFPELKALPDEIRKRFFGGLDTAIRARRL